MNAPHEIDGDEIFIADSWARGESDRMERSRKVAWIIASIATAIALLLAIALVLLLPLKTVEPYTLLVDRQTGYVETLEPLSEQTVSADAALTRSFLVQYVIARESFDVDSVSQDYRKVDLWTVGTERQRYLADMSSANPSSRTQKLPRNTVIRTKVKSVSSLSDNSSLVRFQTVRSDRNGRTYQPQHWAAVITYQYSSAAMSADDRLLNPLGFQVTRYRRDAESLASEPGIVEEMEVVPSSGGPAEDDQS